MSQKGRRARRWWAGKIRRTEPGLSPRARALLEELDRRQLEALQGCSAGLQHGYCRSCGKPIEPRRLQRTRQGAVLCSVCALLARRSRDLLDPRTRRN